MDLLSKAGKLYRKRNVIIYILVIVIVVFALWLRIRCLGIKDLWIDEYFTDDGAFYSFKEMWSKGHTRTTLLFSVIMKYYAAALSFFSHRLYLTPFELRFPNALYGTLLVILVFYALRKISDSFSAVYASLLCTTSAYLVYYSRDGRYYPFMLVWVIICVWSSFNILSNPLYCRNQIKFHLIYMISGICGMFSHYGFWLYFAVSNIALCLILIYRFLTDSSAESFLGRAGKSFLMFLAMAIPAFSVPAIVYKRFGGGVSVVFSEKMYNNDYMLNNLSYKSISNFYQEFICDYKPLIMWIVAILALMAILLLIFYKQKRIILYLILVKYGTFILLRFTPRRIIAEPLRTRYIIFIILLDIILFSLFTGELIKRISQLSIFKRKKLAPLVYLTLTSILIIFTTYYTSSKLFKSDFKIYKPYSKPSQTIEKIKSVYKDGDVVLTDLMEPFFALPYYRKFDKDLKNIKCFYIGWTEKAPQKCDRIILITQKNVFKIPGIISLGQYAGLYCNLLSIPDELYNDDVAFLLSKTINTNDSICKKVLDKWSKKNTNVLDYLNSTNRVSNLVLNHNFSNGFTNWYVKERGDALFSITNINNVSFAVISGKGGWSTLSQNIELKQGKAYKIIVEIKSEDYVKDINFAFCFRDPDKNDKYIYFPGLEESGKWTKVIETIKCNNSGKANIRFQYSNNGKIGLIIIKEVKVIELRDKNVEYQPIKSVSVSNSKLDNSLIYNGDFKDGFSHWSGNFDCFNMLSNGTEIFLSLIERTDEKTWRNLKQLFDTSQDDEYELSFDYRCSDCSNQNEIAYVVFSYMEKGKYIEEEYFRVNRKTTGDLWKHQKHSIQVKGSRKACLRIQFMGNPNCDIKNIQLIKAHDGKTEQSLVPEEGNKNI